MPVPAARVALALLLLAAVSTAAPAQDEASLPRWSIDTVNGPGIQAQYGSIAVGRDGTVAIAFFHYLYDETLNDTPVPYGDLDLALYRNGEWTVQTLVQGAGITPRVAIGDDGAIHIVHSRLGVASWQNLVDLLYTTNEGGSWTTSAIEPGVVKGADASICVEPAGWVHMSARSNMDQAGGLLYVTNRGGSWSWKVVDTTSSAGNDTDIACDDAGTVHISYLDKENGLKYATNASGSWQTEVVDDAPNVGWNTSIALDCGGGVHISYSDPGPLTGSPGLGLLKLAHRGPSAWSIETVDDQGAGYYTNLDIDARGWEHIAYYAWDNDMGSVRYAHRSWNGWSIEEIDGGQHPGEAVGLYCTLDLVDDSGPHVAYLDYRNLTLKHAARPVRDARNLSEAPALSTRTLCPKPPSRRVDAHTPHSMVADWGNLRPLSVNTPCPEDAIEISRDGRTLYFLFTEDILEDLCPRVALSFPNGTYAARRLGGPEDFAAARYWDLGQGTALSLDGEPSFSPDGTTVYFHSNRADNLGYQASPATNDFLDIYEAPLENGEPGPGLNLGPPVNSVYPDGEQAIHPDGVRLFLTSYRPGGMGGADIWVSERFGDGWSDPVNLGPPVDSPADDLQPTFTADGRTMYFVSDRDPEVGTAIYRTSWDRGAWGTPQLVIAGIVGEPSLTADGRLLYFVHVLTDAMGKFDADIWVADRIAE